MKNPFKIFIFFVILITGIGFLGNNLNANYSNFDVSQNVDVPNKNKLDLFLNRVLESRQEFTSEQNYLVFVSKVEDRLSTLRSSYSSNEEINNMLNYLETGVVRIRNISNQNNDLDDFFCDLFGDCDSGSISSSITSSTSSSSSGGGGSQVTYVNLVDGRGLDACNNQIDEKLGDNSNYPCSIGGGCSISGQPSSSSNPSANPRLAGSCIPKNIWDNTNGSSNTNTSTSPSSGGNNGSINSSESNYLKYLGLKSYSGGDFDTFKINVNGFEGCSIYNCSNSGIPSKYENGSYVSSCNGTTSTTGADNKVFDKEFIDTLKDEDTYISVQCYKESYMKDGKKYYDRSSSEYIMQPTKISDIKRQQVNFSGLALPSDSNDNKNNDLKLDSSSISSNGIVSCKFVGKKDTLSISGKKWCEYARDKNKFGDRFEVPSNQKLVSSKVINEDLDCRFSSYGRTRSSEHICNNTDFIEYIDYIKSSNNNTRKQETARADTTLNCSIARDQIGNMYYSAGRCPDNSGYNYWKSQLSGSNIGTISGHFRAGLIKDCMKKTGTSNLSQCFDKMFCP